MKRLAKHLIFVGVLIVVTFAPHFSTAHALARIALPGGWVADVVMCQDGFAVTAYGTLTTGATTTVSVLGSKPAGSTGTVFTFTGPGDAIGTAFFAWSTMQPPGKLAEVTVDRVENGVSVTGGSGGTGLDIVQDCLLMPYTGPALPPPDQRNLVLIVADTSVLDSPGGAPVGGTLKTCQTAFVIGNQGGYGEIFIMGGWINLAATVDVPENYGQPGSPVMPGCEGR